MEKKKSSLVDFHLKDVLIFTKLKERATTATDLKSSYSNWSWNVTITNLKAAPQIYLVLLMMTF